MRYVEIVGFNINRKNSPPCVLECGWKFIRKVFFYNLHRVPTLSFWSPFYFLNGITALFSTFQFFYSYHDLFWTSLHCFFPPDFIWSLGMRISLFLNSKIFFLFINGIKTGMRKLVLIRSLEFFQVTTFNHNSYSFKNQGY